MLQLTVPQIDQSTIKQNRAVHSFLDKDLIIHFCKSLSRTFSHDCLSTSLSYVYAVGLAEANTVVTMQDNPSYASMEGVKLEPNPCYSTMQETSDYV